MNVINFQCICCSNTAAASKRPIPRKMLMRLDKAKSSRFRASHKWRMASVGLGLVAKKVTYRCTLSLSANSLQSWPSGVGGSNSLANEANMFALSRKRPECGSPKATVAAVPVKKLLLLEVVEEVMVPPAEAVVVNVEAGLDLGAAAVVDAAAADNSN